MSDIRHHSALSSYTPPGSPAMPGRGIGEHILKHSARSTPEPPLQLPRLLPGLLDSALIREHAALDDDSPCAFGKPKKTWREYWRTYTRPESITALDYGLP